MVYLVGKYTWKEGKEGGEMNDLWEVVGIFEDESRAKQACRGDNYFVGPIELNKDLEGENSETIEWPGAYYPTHFNKKFIK